MTLKTSLTGKRLFLAASALALAACGSDDKIQSVGGSSQSADQEKDGGDSDRTVDEKQMPPKGYYDALFEEQLKLLDQGVPPASGSQVLWINFGGAAVSKGFNRGQSFILCRASANVPAAGLSPTDEDAVLAGVQKFFDDAGAQLVITNAQPSSGDYTTMHVGGTFADLGCVGPGVLGVAPFDVGNANRNDVGFAFTKNASAAIIAETVAHEAGHSFGLDHVSNNKDLMFASSSPGITGFAVSTISGSNKLQDGPALLQQALGAGNATQTPGGSSPSPAQPATPVAGIPNLPGSLAGLPGLDQIGNIGQLLPGLAPGSVLDISQLLPQIQSLIPIASSGVGLPGLDKILTIVGVAGAAQGAQGGTTPAATPAAGALGGLIDPALAGAVLGGVTGAGGLGSLATLAGFGDITQYVAAAQGALNGAGAGAAATIPQLGAVPDLSALLGLAGSTPDIATLLQSLAGTSQVVNGNFTGANKDALLSLVKLAYTQQYIDLLQGVAP